VATKTLIANLGVPGKAIPTPAPLASLQIDGEPVTSVQAMVLVIDASQSQPAAFTFRRVAILDGLEFMAVESHVISNLSLIIEYEQEA